MAEKSAEFELVGDLHTYELRDVCELCAVRADVVLEMVELGILAPSGSRPTDWRFSVGGLNRLRKAQRLQRDLDVNLAGIALALDLLDDLEVMRKRTQTLEHHLSLLVEDYSQ